MVASANELLYFIELAKTLNFSRAAERIGISQPSLSMAIKRLEQAMGVDLFIRDKHKVMLTQAGHNLCSHALQLLQLWDVTKKSCLASLEEVQGKVSLGCHPSIALYFFPKFLPQLLKNYPRLEVNIAQDLSRKVAEQIINFSIDIGMVVNPIQHPDLIIKKLFDDRVTCWQASDLGADSLASEQQILMYDPELRQSQVILKQLQARNISFKRVITTNNLELIAKLCAEGMGIAILPGSVVDLLNQPNVIPCVDAPVYYDEICVVYRHENRNNKAIQVTIDAMKNISANV